MGQLFSAVMYHAKELMEVDPNPIPNPNPNRSFQIGMDQLFTAFMSHAKELMDVHLLQPPVTVFYNHMCQMGMDQLFSAVMVHAKELMEVDRSTLFLYDKPKGMLFTLVADCADQILIPATKGLAGATFTHKKLINIADAYR